MGPQRVRLTRAIEFSSSLRLARRDLSPAENARLFGARASQHGHNYRLEVTVAGAPDPKTGMVMDGVVLVVNYAFLAFDLRKIYAELPETNLSQFSSGTGRLFEEEARLKEHVYREGAYCDLVYLSISRSLWKSCERLVQRVLDGGD